MNDYDVNYKKMTRRFTTTLILTAVFGILALILLSRNTIILQVLGGIFVISALISFAICYFTFKKLGKFCSKCHHPLDGCAYETTPISTKTSNEQTNIKFHVNYIIRFECPNCGASSSEKKEFTSNQDYKECEFKLNEYCFKRFGH